MLSRKVTTLALIAFCGAAAAVCQAATVNISPGIDIPAVVDANPAGTTFVIHPGVYRMQTIIPKNGDIFIGESGAILNGSRLLTSFSKEIVNGVTYWVAEGPTQPGLLLSRCDDNFPMCRYPENLYIDNKPFLRASSLSSITTGTCYYDYSAGKIYFVDNPIGHTVETSSTPVAFQTESMGKFFSNVTIQGLIIEKYATPGLRSTIGGQYGGSNWIVENNEVRLNHGEGVRVGNGSQVLNNYIHDNGQMGIGISMTTTAVLVQNNEIARNNWAHFRVTFEAGGVKFGQVLNLTARDNYIHDNVGVGLWCDGSCSGGLYENNTVANNTMHGIMHEISHSWTIRNNVSIGNGGAGIQIDESDHVEVANNFVADNYKAIAMTMVYRASWADLNNNYVHDNIIVTGGVNGITGLYQKMNNNAYYTSKNNRFANNTYCMPASSRGYYWWMNWYQTTEAWKGYGQDVSGKWACPGVYISSPSNAATLSGKVLVSTFAADTVSVTKVLYYVDGVLVGTSTTKASTTSPYTYTWDTTKDTNGRHTLEAKAYNHDGQSSTSSVTVTVQNP